MFYGVLWNFMRSNLLIQPVREQDADPDGQMEEPPPEALLQKLEARHEMCISLWNQMEGQAVAVDDPEVQREVEDARRKVECRALLHQELDEKSKLSGKFSAFQGIKDQVSKLACFQEDKAEYKGRSGCHARDEHLFGPMQKFVKEVRVSEGILSGVLVCLSMS